jgi:non-ribosomal peptide synthetase component F
MSERQGRSQSIARAKDFVSETLRMQPDERRNGVWAHERIAHQAIVAPSASALRDERKELTFGELDQRANCLARHLQTLGVAAETPVGLYFERSSDFVVAALAVLKGRRCVRSAGCRLSAGRIDAILKDAAVPVLLSHKWMAASLAGGPMEDSRPRYRCSRHCGSICGGLYGTGKWTATGVHAYTSGSTGQPKGVEVTHANLEHLIAGISVRLV